MLPLLVPTAFCRRFTACSRAAVIIFRSAETACRPGSLPLPLIMGCCWCRILSGNDAMLYTASLRTNVELPLLRRSASFGGRIRRKFLDGEVERAAKAVGISPGQLGEPLAPPLILRAQLMRILLSHRPVLLLENPFVGLSPADDHLLRRFLVHFARDGNCVLFTSAHFSEMSEICTHCYQLTDGLLPVQSTAPEGRRLG